MRARNWTRRASVLLLLGVFLTVGLTTSAWDEKEVQGIGAGCFDEVLGVKPSLHETSEEGTYLGLVAVMGQLTRDGEPLPGAFFFLYNCPDGDERRCGQQGGSSLEWCFPNGITANGAQVSYVQGPNAIVTFSISPSQFRKGIKYGLPFLPEDPPGAGALEFF
jgi:hypothetical protein